MKICYVCMYVYKCYINKNVGKFRAICFIICTINKCGRDQFYKKNYVYMMDGFNISFLFYNYFVI